MTHSLTKWQLFSLYFLFELGTSVIFGFGGGGNQDAWIATGISSAIGIGLIWLYCKLFEWYPNKNWIALMIHIFGRYIGNIVAALYIACMIYDAGRDMRDFGELMHTYLLPKTPMVVVMFMLGLIVIYCCSVGLSRIGRFAELLVPIVMIILAVEFILLTATNIYNFSFLAPVAANWKDIAKTVFPVGITVPFGESISFALFWAITVPPHVFRKTVIVTSLIVGVLLVLLDLVAIATLGPMFSRLLYPMLSAFQLISVGDFVDNIDALVVTNFMIGGLFKIVVLTFGACVGIAEQWKVKEYRSVLIPVVCIVLILAVNMADNIITHVLVGVSWVPWTIFVPLFIVIPLLSLLIAKTVKST